MRAAAFQVVIVISEEIDAIILTKHSLFTCS
jgi:hypothetical protein